MIGVDLALLEVGAPFLGGILVKRVRPFQMLKSQDPQYGPSTPVTSIEPFRSPGIFDAEFLQRDQDGFLIVAPVRKLDDKVDPASMFPFKSPAPSPARRFGRF